MHTTTSTYPWYHTLKPRTIPLPGEIALKDPSNPREIKYFAYKYAIFQNGVFHRWEQVSDCPSDLLGDGDMLGGDGDVTMEESMDAQRSDLHHEIPLRTLHQKETYVVSDVLGTTRGPTDIEHILEPSEPAIQTVDSLLDTTKHRSSGNLRSSSNTSVPSMSQTSSAKHVGFAPTPPPLHPKTSRKQQVHLNSTDGLVVVSVFLPVVLNRSTDGVWTADWDYEMLLSMQTHLRVTRVGVVKWRGWHGNTGAKGSPESGVPVAERAKVEACLRPFNCVPVWVEPSLFGDM